MQLQTGKLVGGMIVCGFGFIVLGTEFLVKPAERNVVVGWICLVFSLCVFVAPLAIVVSVRILNRLGPINIHDFQFSLKVEYLY